MSTLRERMEAGDPDEMEPGAGPKPAPADDAKAPAPQQQDPAAPIPGMGFLLEEPDHGKVFRAIDKIISRQEPLAKNREQIGLHWSRVRRGVPFAKLSKDENKATYSAKLPPGISDYQSPVPNKADDLCTKMVAQVLVDRPLPDPKPMTDAEGHRSAAALAKKFLKADGEESGTNDVEAFRDCLDTNQTRGSAFVHLYVDANGGGWRPKQIKAHPQAIDASNPLLGPDGMPTTDYVLRYVTDAGQFTDSPVNAGMQWQPKLAREVLMPAHVRTVPETEPVGTADAVILLRYATLGALKSMAAGLDTLTDAQLAALVAWKPERWAALVPKSMVSTIQSQARNADESAAKPSDDAIVFYYLKYCRATPAYPKGARVLVTGGGGGRILERRTWSAVVPTQDESADGKQGETTLCLEIPVAQFKALHDSEDRDPFGRAPIEKFGASNAMRASLFGGFQQLLELGLNPNVFLSALSSIQEIDLNARTGRPIITSGPEDKPFYEPVPPVPAALPDMLGRLDTDMDNAAGLSQTAQGNDVGSAVSGIAKQMVVQQAKVALSQYYQNTVSAITRYWRLKLQLAQAFLTVPQQMAYVGEDGAWRQEWFTGADFSGVRDVAIAAGTGTMMAPQEKATFLQVAQLATWVTPEEASDAIRHSMGDDLGLPQTKARERVKREVSAWTDGPPDGWTPATPMVDAMGMPAVDPMTGQPAVQPASWTPFQPRPTDEDPSVAVIRYRELRELVESVEYMKQPPEWRALVDAEYTRMMQAAGVATIRQQQEAAAQQQMAEQQNADADRSAKGEQADKDRAAQQTDSEASRAHAERMQQMKGEQGAQVAAMKQPTAA